MWQLMRENPLGTLVVMLCLIWAVERILRSIIERNKPHPPCCDSEDDEDDEE